MLTTAQLQAIKAAIDADPVLSAQPLNSDGAFFIAAEIGHIRGRVCVGEPSITVYVDPQIRGLS
jgi:hypothetical protein